MGWDFLPHLFLFCHMRRVFAFAALLSLLLAGCSKESRMVINGTISSQWDGVNVYFCPLPHPTEDVVDSTAVKNGTFTFTIPADSCYVARLQLDATVGSDIQMLYVAVEPGILNVELSENSHGGGTPLNDTLQVWKEYISAAQKASSPMHSFALSEQILEYTANLVCNNPNGVGGYLLWRYGRFFPDSTKARIDSLGITKYIPDVSTRKPNK